jgi:type I restriction enzyme, S subunit
MTQWRTATIESACNVEYGTRVVQKRDGGSIYPVYGGGGATFSMDTTNRADRVVVARFGMSEECTRYVSGEFFLNDSGLTLSPKDKGALLPEFLDRLTLCLNDDIFALGKGAAQKNLDVPAFRGLRISFPESLDEQRRIVAILDEAFEGIATAKANAEKNLQNARELYESKVQSSFARIGKKWEFVPLATVCEVKDGTHDSPKYVVDGIPFVTQKNIRADGLSFANTKFIGDEDHAKYYRRSNVAIGDILISMIGANRGMACLVDDDRIFSIKNVGLVKASNRFNPHFLLAYLKSASAARYVQAGSKGGAQSFIGLTELRAFPVPLPPKDAQFEVAESLAELAAMTDRLLVVYQTKLDALDELKQSLLHQAFTGALTDKAAAKQLEAVV